MSKLPCYYAHGGLNYKNGFATTCPISGARLKMLNDDQVPSEFWNNAQFKEYRQMLDRGEWPQDCILCKVAEEVDGTESMRQDYDADLSHYNPKTGEVKFTGLKHIELRFSNACNMACLHCSEVYSSQWGSRLKNYTPDENDVKHNLKQILKTEHRYGFSDKTKIDLKTDHVIEIVEDLNKNFPNIEKVDFAGGEVLYQKQFFPCLRKLAEHPNAKNMKVFFHTNFNADFDVNELNELLKMFGTSQIKISVDSGTNIYNYFRGGNWNVLKNNLEKIKKINDFSQIDVVCTTSIYQIMDIQNIFESLLDLDVNAIDASIVYTPTYLNPAVLMQNFEEKVLEDLEKTKQRILQIEQERYSTGHPQHWRSYNDPYHFYKGFWDIKRALDSVETIKKYVTSHQTEPKDWKAFKHYRQKMDKLWKQNFNDHFKIYKAVGEEIVRVKENDPYYDVIYNDEYIIQPDNLYADEIESWNKHILDLENNPKDELIQTENFKMVNKELKEQIKNSADHKESNELIKKHHEEQIRKILIKREEENKKDLIKKGLDTFNHDAVIIPLNKEWKNIMVMLSGGADSACLTYLLCKRIQELNLQIKVHVLSATRVWKSRPWAEQVSVDVYEWLKNKFPNIIGERHSYLIPTYFEHGHLGNAFDGKPGEAIILKEVVDYICNNNSYDAVYNATTMNPPNYQGERMENRDDSNLDTKTLYDAMDKYWRLTPLRRTAKNWIIKQYKDFGITDLLNTTRSCEGDAYATTNMYGLDWRWYRNNKNIHECGVCFWCKEREWAKKQNEF